MSPAEHGVAQSVRQRLLDRSRDTGEDYNLLLTRYSVERLLYRLSQSEHVDSFVLKGAMLFTVWKGAMHRPTRDLDLLGFGEASEERLVGVFRSVCDQTVDDDGMSFDANSVTAAPIRGEHTYAGIRLRIATQLGSARLNLQVDVGFGDVVTPEAGTETYPTLLDQPAPRLRMYSPESVIAEKLEAMVSLGMANSRMKDYYDIWVLLQQFNLDDTVLAAAIRATFDRRRTAIPSSTPLALTDEFAVDPDKQRQWFGFLRRSGLPDAHELATVVKTLRARLLPLLAGQSE
ncbi:MAG: nucleotidyl transferase AbiEii/AbiGii toxin family protein [Phycisphaerae bacterium]